MNKKSSIIITAIVTLISIFTLTWLSCSKPSQPNSCYGVICENGGYCSMDTVKANTLGAVCTCPAGFEGPTCATISVDKYLGTWDLKQHIFWSDSANYIGTNSNYSVILEKTATNTTFFINNFFNNPYYNNIICDIDSGNSFRFNIDTLSDFHEYYDHYQVKWGRGTISGNTINDTLFIRFKNGTSNWQQDSLTFQLTPHQQ